MKTYCGVEVEFCGSLTSEVDGGE